MNDNMFIHFLQERHHFSPKRIGCREEVRGLSKLKKAAAAALALLGARALLAGGVSALSGGAEGLLPAVLSLELGRPAAAAVSATPTPSPEAAGRDAGGAQGYVSIIAAPEPSPEAAGPEPTPPSVDSDGTPIVETTIYSGVAIKNGTEIDIDTAALLAAGPTQVLPAEGPQVLIVHTHGSEAYTPDSRDYYEETDTDRTEDTNYNVVRVGDELAAALTEQGLNVLHDREIYDYPSYTGSYSRSGAAVEEYLEQYPDIAVVIDLHRDALGDADVTYKTVAELSGESCSQVMLLVGTGESGLWHPQWEQNLRLALYLQDAVNDRYPTLMRPVSVTPERYNQHLTTGSLILEVGSNGNTLREALNAVRLFAQAAGPALLSLVKTAF